MLHLSNVFRENKDSDNCAQLLEEECIRMFGTKSLYDEHDCNVVSMNSLNIMMLMICKATSLGKLCLIKMIFFCPPNFDENIYYDESMPAIYDDYCDDTYAIN